MNPERICLQDQVHQALRQSPYIAQRRLTGEADEGRVVLRGAVRSYFEKQMAQEALRRLDGILEIDNRLEVVPPASPRSL